ncbi:MAG: hypothetical protein FJ029_10370 [Actinobacteria bacterium]|nr:hypothetical protein [Actinomycetota bacterium]
MGARVFVAMLLNGGVMGAANVAQNLFLLAALRTIPGSLVFPIQSSVSVLLMNAAGYALWHERHGREALVGVVLACTGLVLVNV